MKLHKFFKRVLLLNISHKYPKDNIYNISFYKKSTKDNTLYNYSNFYIFNKFLDNYYLFFSKLNFKKSHKIQCHLNINI